MAKCFIFLNKKIYYVFYKKKKERCTFLSSHKTHKYLLFWMHFQLKVGTTIIIQNLGQPTMNILTTILVIENEKQDFLSFLFSYFPCYFLVQITKQHTQRHISCKRRQQSALLLREIQLQHIRFFFLPRFLFTEITEKKISVCFILFYFYLLQILPCLALIYSIMKKSFLWSGIAVALNRQRTQICRGTTTMSI